MDLALVKAPDWPSTNPQAENTEAQRAQPYRYQPVWHCSPRSSHMEEVKAEEDAYRAALLFTLQEEEAALDSVK